ncbi:MAG: hypothetical protein H6706_20270 [Myxococcales bacterium]|nr:hypothetical protein [Myxococcales bacterium]
MKLRTWLWVLALAGCDDQGAGVVDATSPTVRDARVPRDVGAADAGDVGLDAVIPPDAGRPADAAVDDAAATDARVADARPTDAALVDAAADAEADAARDAQPAPPDAGDPCAEAIDLRQAMAEQGFYDGDTARAPARTLGTCGGAAGGEILFRYEVLPGEDEVVFATDHPETQAATVLYLRAACDDAADVACVRGNDAAPGTRLTFRPPGPGTWYLVVDTGSRAGGGPFRLTAGPPPPPACSDGRDNDGDGRVDLDDPGCAAPEDESEGDPVPLPTCADGLDNDDDGLVDFPADPDCLAAGDDGERGACEGEDPCDGRNQGPDFLDGSSTGGPWIAWRWQAPEAATVRRLTLFSGERPGATALGLYTSSAGDTPDRLLARGAFNLAAPNGWQGADLDPPAEVEAGVTYWIVWETVAGAQSPFAPQGQAVDYRGSPDQGRSWNGPFQQPVKFQVFCCGR